MREIDERTKMFVKKIFRLCSDYCKACMENDQEQIYRILSKMYSENIKYYYTDKKERDSLLIDDDERQRYINNNIKILENILQATIETVKAEVQ